MCYNFIDKTTSISLIPEVMNYIVFDKGQLFVPSLLTIFTVQNIVHLLMHGGKVLSTAYCLVILLYFGSNFVLHMIYLNDLFFFRYFTLYNVDAFVLFSSTCSV